MKIGVTSTEYPIKRNIIGKIPDAEYLVLRKNNNFYHSLSTVIKLLLRKKENLEGKYYYWQKPKLDVLHLYNQINYSSQKWVTSFETLVPRFDETKNDHQKTEPSHSKNNKTEKALQQICKSNCLGIISISNASAEIQHELLKNYPKYEEIIRKKLHVIHPAQEVLPHNENKSHYLENGLTLIFVGTQFHLKGGVEMVEVLKNLKKQYNFKLIIISSFKTDNYVTHVTREETEKTKKELEKEDWIEIYQNIPNEKVLNLIKDSHIGLLPTWSDTYGFSVLEMQAAGVPVITTDIRALPEINNNQCGWLIHLPQNRLKQALYFTEAQKKELRETLKHQLEEILVNIFANKDILKEKSKAAIERIKEEHNPEKVKEKLLKIYNQ